MDDARKGRRKTQRPSMGILTATTAAATAATGASTTLVFDGAEFPSPFSPTPGSASGRDLSLEIASSHELVVPITTLSEASTKITTLESSSLNGNMNRSSMMASKKKKKRQNNEEQPPIEKRMRYMELNGLQKRAMLDAAIVWPSSGKKEGSTAECSLQQQFVNKIRKVVKEPTVENTCSQDACVQSVCTKDICVAEDWNLYQNLKIEPLPFAFEDFQKPKIKKRESSGTVEAPGTKMRSSCDSCTKLKIKCTVEGSEMISSCAACIRKGRTCSYSPQRKRGPRYSVKSESNDILLQATVATNGKLNQNA